MTAGRAARTIAIALIAAAVSPLPAPAFAGAGASATAQGCWYYSESDFQGARAEIVNGSEVAPLDDKWNDRISSITCHPLCTLTAFDLGDKTGTQKRFTGDVRNVGEAWNDRISAMSVTCRRRVRSVG